MVGIDVLKQVIEDRELIRHLLVAQRLEQDHVVGAIAVRIDHLPGGRDLAGQAVALDRETRQHVAFDRIAMGLDLSPGDVAVVVAVDADGEIQIAQRDVELSQQRVGIRGIGVQIHIGVTLLVRQGRRRAARRRRAAPARQYSRAGSPGPGPALRSAWVPTAGRAAIFARTCAARLTTIGYCRWVSASCIEHGLSRLGLAGRQRRFEEHPHVLGRMLHRPVLLRQFQRALRVVLQKQLESPPASRR